MSLPPALIPGRRRVKYHEDTEFLIKWDGHETYGKMLSAAEKRLMKIYDAAIAGGDAAVTDEKGKGVVVDVEIDEEVVKILKEVERGGVVERVNLARRELRLLPEVFGRIKPLLVLDLSNNQS